MGVGRWVWVWGGGCRCEEVGVGVGRWVWGGGCGEVGAGRWVWVWAWRIQLLYKTLHTEPDSIVSSSFVQSVIFCHSLCGLLNKLEGVGKWVWL